MIIISPVIIHMVLYGMHDMCVVYGYCLYNVMDHYTILDNCLYTAVYRDLSEAPVRLLVKWLRPFSMV